MSELKIEKKLYTVKKLVGFDSFIFVSSDGTENGRTFDDANFTNSLGLDVQDGDEVEISAKVISRVVTWRVKV